MWNEAFWLPKNVTWQDFVELEQQVAQMENRQRELTQLLQNPLVHAPGGTAPDLSRELTDITRKLYVANSEWERELALLEQA